jgi:hypothetical protein
MKNLLTLALLAAAAAAPEACAQTPEHDAYLARGRAEVAKHISLDRPVYLKEGGLVCNLRRAVSPDPQQQRIAIASRYCIAAGAGHRVGLVPMGVDDALDIIYYDMVRVVLQPPARPGEAQVAVTMWTLLSELTNDPKEKK